VTAGRPRSSKSILPRCLTLDQRQRFHLAPAAPRWCHSMNLWPYDDPAKTPMPPLTWDDRIANVVQLLSRRESHRKGRMKASKSSPSNSGSSVAMK
jgi:hypothetical protein